MFCLHDYMWRCMGKPGLLGDENSRLWSDAARSARRQIKAWTFCRSWTSTENIFLAFCKIWIENVNRKMGKMLIKEPTVFSSITRFSHAASHILCDVAWENRAYWGTKSPGFDLTPRILRGVRSKPWLFVTYEHLKKTLFSLSAKFENKMWIER